MWHLMLNEYFFESGTTFPFLLSKPQATEMAMAAMPSEVLLPSVSMGRAGLGASKNVVTQQLTYEQMDVNPFLMTQHPQQADVTSNPNTCSARGGCTYQFSYSSSSSSSSLSPTFMVI